MARLLMIVTMIALSPAAHAAETTLVARGSTWKFLDNGSNQGTAWRPPLFNDATWSEGPAQLGYGDGDEVTLVGFGGNPNDVHITTYFRHAFEVSDVALFDRALLGVLRDDGVVVYLNGVEVHRANLPLAGIGYLTQATSTAEDAEERVFEPVCIDPALLVKGTNVLAVEVHQTSPTSSDVSFDLELRVTDGEPFVTRGPYLQSNGPDRVVVRWRTCEPTESLVCYGAAPGRLTEQAGDLVLTTEHEVALAGLDADSTYFYAIGTATGIQAGDDADHFFVTAPAPGEMRPLRIWATGDTGEGNQDAADVRDAYLSRTGSRHTDVWLMLGDNAYNDGLDIEHQGAVFDMYAALLRQTSVWPTIGNHDDNSADSPTQTGVYFDVFTLPTGAEAGGFASGTEAYYSFDVGNVHFVCLDSSDTNRAPTGAMMTWLEADLGDTLADWIIAFWHHPPYTKGSHDSDDNTDSGGRMRDMRLFALPRLEAAGVDLVLCGHSHVYERSFLLDGHYGPSSTLMPEMILDGGDGRDDGDGAYTKATVGRAGHEGAVYVVAGSSAKISDDSPLDHPVMFVGMEQLGSLVIDVNGPHRMNAAFIDETGSERDHFTIIKGCEADLDGDGTIGVSDLLLMLSGWGPCAECFEDLDGNGAIDAVDLLALLAEWGECS